MSEQTCAIGPHALLTRWDGAGIEALPCSADRAVHMGLPFEPRSPTSPRRRRPAPSLRGCGRAQERKVAAVVRTQNFLRIQLGVTSFGLRRYRLHGGRALF